MDVIGLGDESGALDDVPSDKQQFIAANEAFFAAR
jgi:hypothetical protein